MRPPPSVLLATLDLARLVRGERPPWLRTATWALLQRAVAAVVEDVRAVLAEQGVDRGAVALGVSRSALQRARREGEPLAERGA